MVTRSQVARATASPMVMSTAFPPSSTPLWEGLIKLSALCELDLQNQPPFCKAVDTNENVFGNHLLDELTTYQYRV